MTRYLTATPEAGMAYVSSVALLQEVLKCSFRLLVFIVYPQPICSLVSSLVLRALSAPSVLPVQSRP